MKKIAVLFICLFAILLVFKLSAEDKNDREPLAAYKTGNLWHFIDYEGKELFPPVELENVRGYAEGMFCVSKKIKRKEKWGYIDLKGKFVIEPKYDKANLFSHGYALVWEIHRRRIVPIALSFIDKSGNKLNKEDLLDGLDFSEGLAFAMDKNRASGYINTSGEYVITFDKIVGNKFNGGFASASNDDIKFGFINKKGELIVDYIYESIGNFSEGLASVYKDAKFGYIDTAGEFKIEPEFDYAHEFINGRAFVGDLYPYRMKIRWGLIDKSGNFIVDYIYPSITDFSEDAAAVRDSVRWGFIDINGDYIIESQFTFASSFVKGIAWASKKHEGLFGYIDKKGEFIITIDEFDKIIDLRLNKKMY